MGSSKLKFRKAGRGRRTVTSHAGFDEVSFDDLFSDGLDEQELADLAAISRRGASPGVEAGRRLGSVWGSESPRDSDAPGTSAAQRLSDAVREVCSQNGVRPLQAMFLLRQTEHGRDLLKNYRAHPTHEWKHLGD
jgi:hypothetical protein